MRYPPFQLAEWLEQQLGNPHDPHQPFSYANCAELDEREEFPSLICRELDRLGLPRYYVPAALGGALNSYEDLAALLRSLSRRDLTVAVGHISTFLGAASVWIAGDAEQAQSVAMSVVNGCVVSLALSEREHGSDLLAGDVMTLLDGGCYRISGEKWLIGNISRGQQVCLLARTEPEGGARGYSLLLVDKRQLAPGAYRCLPAVSTVGLRGADIGGIHFTDARVPASAVVGPVGAGLETVLKCLQLTRTLCGSMSLGVGDQALRLTTRFSIDHEESQLTGPATWRRQLGEAYADLLAAEAVSLVGTRAIHALPEELSVMSAVVKYFVPISVEQIISDLGQLLDPLVLLSDDEPYETFQKLERDHHIMSIFDGNTFVNLNALINQFPQLAKAYERNSCDTAGLISTLSLAGPLQEADPGRLRLLSRGGCSLVQMLPACISELVGLSAEGIVSERLAGYALELREISDTLHTDMANHRPSARAVPAEAFEMARRYTTLFAAAACVQLWLQNRLAVQPFTTTLWQNGLWLEATLVRLLDRLEPSAYRDPAPFDQLYDQLLWQYRDCLLFSVLHCRLEELA